MWITIKRGLHFCFTFSWLDELVRYSTDIEALNSFHLIGICFRYNSNLEHCFNVYAAWTDKRRYCVCFFINLFHLFFVYFVENGSYFFFIYFVPFVPFSITPISITSHFFNLQFSLTQNVFHFLHMSTWNRIWIGNNHQLICSGKRAYCVSIRLWLKGKKKTIQESGPCLMMMNDSFFLSLPSHVRILPTLFSFRIPQIGKIRLVGENRERKQEEEFV